MKCSNARCGKTIDTPLELYDGRWACPYCKSIIGATSGSFRMTEENVMLFRRSEMCFLRWLTSGREKHEKSGMKLLDRAVTLCKRAALAGNPEAAIRLGYYYDKDFVETNRSETARCRVAYNYYASVCFARQEGALTAEAGVVAPEWNDLRRKAAELLLRMLAYTPEELDALDTYNFARNKALAEKLLGVRFNINRAMSKSDTDRVKETLAVLSSCGAAERAPLFGVLGLSGAELSAVIGSREFYPMLSRRRVRLSVMAADADGSVRDDEQLQPLSNRMLIEKVIGDYTSSEVYVCFFNERSKYAAVGRTLEEHDGRLIKELISGGRKLSYVFYDDDITMYKKGGIAGAARRLIDAVTGRQE